MSEQEEQDPILADLQLLLEACHPHAEKELRENEGFIPFGAVMNPDGEIELNTYEEDDETPDDDVLLDDLGNQFLADMELGKIKAFGVCFESTVKSEAFPEGIGAISILLLHNEYPEKMVYHFPFEWKDKNLEFYEPFGEFEDEDEEEENDGE